MSPVCVYRGCVTPQAAFARVDWATAAATRRVSNVSAPPPPPGAFAPAAFTRWAPVACLQCTARHAKMAALVLTWGRRRHTRAPPWVTHLPWRRPIQAGMRRRYACNAPIGTVAVSLMRVCRVLCSPLQLYGCACPAFYYNQFYEKNFGPLTGSTCTKRECVLCPSFACACLEQCVAVWCRHMPPVCGPKVYCYRGRSLLGAPLRMFSLLHLAPLPFPLEFRGAIAHLLCDGRRVLPFLSG